LFRIFPRKEEFESLGLTPGDHILKVEILKGKG